MFPLSFLALKYSYFKRGKKKSVTAAYRSKGEKKEDSEQERWEEREKLTE